MPEVSDERRDDGTNGATPVQVKPGRHREATLYHALAGAGAGNGRTLEQLREAALKSYETSELPVWRRSGFWTTSLQSLDLDALQTAGAGDSIAVEPGVVPEIVTRTLPDRPHAGRIVQSAGSVVHVELDPALAERGVILCSLEQAFQDHRELAERWYSKRLTIDRHKLEAANAAFWTGGAFLHVPKGVVVEDPFEIVYAIDGPGVAQYARTLVVGGEQQRVQAARVRPRGGLLEGQALHAGAFELYLEDGARCRLAQVQDWGTRRGVRRARRASSASGATPTATGCRRCSAGTSCASTWSWRSQSPAATWPSAGLFFTEEHEHLDVFAVDLHETGPVGRGRALARRRDRARAARASRG